MGSLFSYDNAFMQFLNKLTAFLYLGLLWSLFSIPIITVGASTTALYYTAFKLLREDETSVFQTFFHAFRHNFKVSTICWFLYLLLGIIIGIDAMILERMRLWHIIWSFALFVFILIIYIIIGLYLFPLIAGFDNNILNYFKNALALGIKFIFSTLILLLIHALTIFAVFIFPPFAFFCMGCIAYVNAHILLQIFQKLHKTTHNFVHKDEEKTE